MSESHFWLLKMWSVLRLSYCCHGKVHPISFKNFQEKSTIIIFRDISKTLCLIYMKFIHMIFICNFAIIQLSLNLNFFNKIKSKIPFQMNVIQFHVFENFYCQNLWAFH